MPEILFIGGCADGQRHEVPSSYPTVSMSRRPDRLVERTIYNVPIEYDDYQKVRIGDDDKVHEVFLCVTHAKGVIETLLENYRPKPPRRFDDWKTGADYR